MSGKPLNNRTQSRTRKRKQHQDQKQKRETLNLVVLDPASSDRFLVDVSVESRIWLPILRTLKNMGKSCGPQLWRCCSMFDVLHLGNMSCWMSFYDDDNPEIEFQMMDASHVSLLSVYISAEDYISNLSATTSKDQRLSHIRKRTHVRVGMEMQAWYTFISTVARGRELPVRIRILGESNGASAQSTQSTQTTRPTRMWASSGADTIEIPLLNASLDENFGVPSQKEHATMTVSTALWFQGIAAFVGQGAPVHRSTRDEIMLCPNPNSKQLDIDSRGIATSLPILNSSGGDDYRTDGTVVRATPQTFAGRYFLQTKPLQLLCPEVSIQLPPTMPVRCEFKVPSSEKTLARHQEFQMFLTKALRAPDNFRPISLIADYLAPWQTTIDFFLAPRIAEESSD